ncbi:MAG: DUF2059 domain-containing protein [Verrucomicrobiota bacterium]
MKNLLLAAMIAAISLIAPAHAEITKEKRQEVEKMLQLTGMEKLFVQMKTQMLSGLKSKLTSVPDSFWEKFQEKMDTHELVEKIIPLYDKYYTLEDLKAINAFYESPVGKKILTTLPQIMQESMKIGQEWGEKIGRQAVEEAQKESEKEKE